MSLRSTSKRKAIGDENDKDSYVDPRMPCPVCALIMSSRSISRHLQRAHGGKTQLNNLQPNSKKAQSAIPDNTNDTGLIQQMCATMPQEVYLSIMKSTNRQPYKLQFGSQICGEFLSIQALSVLQSIPDLSITRINESSKAFEPDHGRLMETHMELNKSDIEVIDTGGGNGMERLLGAVVVTDNQTLEIRCIEVYCRDVCEDPHAEVKLIPISSVPDATSSTQYEGLKMVQTPDGYGNLRFAIGTRRYNYLITHAKIGGKSKMGPTAGDVFPLTPRTTLFIKKIRQGSNIFNGDILGLAQVRSCFGHPATYTNRRAALSGYSSISQMPLTVFTLCQWNIPYSKVFHNLWKRSQKPGEEIVLMLQDVDNVPDNATGKTAEITRKLIKHLSISKSVRLIDDPVAEGLLSDVASSFSSEISKKNNQISLRTL